MNSWYWLQIVLSCWAGQVAMIWENITANTAPLSWADGTSAVVKIQDMLYWIRKVNICHHNVPNCPISLTLYLLILIYLLKLVAICGSSLRASGRASGIVFGSKKHIQIRQTVATSLSLWQSRGVVTHPL